MLNVLSIQGKKHQVNLRKEQNYASFADAQSQLSNSHLKHEDKTMKSSKLNHTGMASSTQMN